MPPESKSESVPLTLRRAILRDSEPVGRLIESVIAELGFDMADEGEVYDWRAVLANFEDSPDQRFWVLEAAEDSSGGLGIVGTVSLKRHDAESAVLGRLYLAVGYRGQGLGRLLAETVLQEARALGYARIVLETHRSLEAGNRLYHALGFEEIPPYSGHPLHYTDVAYALML